MIEVPYVARVGALLLLAVILVLCDRLRGRGGNERLWEYGMLFLAGTVGALYGAVNDAITSAISPDYFVVGKGLEDYSSLRRQAMILGAQAGFSAAVIAAAIWLFAIRRIAIRQRCLPVLRFAWLPITIAVALSILMPTAFRHADPFGFAALIGDRLPADVVRKFLIVWWAHIGAYSGLLAGLCAGICICRKKGEMNAEHHIRGSENRGHGQETHSDQGSH